MTTPPPQAKPGLAMHPRHHVLTMAHHDQPELLWAACLTCDRTLAQHATPTEAARLTTLHLQGQHLGTPLDRSTVSLHIANPVE